MIRILWRLYNRKPWPQHTFREMHSSSKGIAAVGRAPQNCQHLFGGFWEGLKDPAMEVQPPWTGKTPIGNDGIS